RGGDHRRGARSRDRNRAEGSREDFRSLLSCAVQRYADAARRRPRPHARAADPGVARRAGRGRVGARQGLDVPAALPAPETGGGGCRAGTRTRTADFLTPMLSEAKHQPRRREDGSADAERDGSRAAPSLILFQAMLSEAKHQRRRREDGSADAERDGSRAAPWLIPFQVMLSEAKHQRRRREDGSADVERDGSRAAPWLILFQTHAERSEASTKAPGGW